MQFDHLTENHIRTYAHTHIRTTSQLGLKSSSQRSSLSETVCPAVVAAHRGLCQAYMILQDLSSQIAVVITTILLGGIAYFTFLRFNRIADVQPVAGVSGGESGGRLISRKEVGKHCVADDLWIILKNQQSHKLSVYDITAYVEEHPGGQAILNNAGKDSTKGFYGPQHPSRVFDMIEDFYIGDLQS